MRNMVRMSSILALSCALSCGDSSGGEKSDPDEIVYPDSFCDAKACSANEDDSASCDPDASDARLTDCNAWRVDGSFSLQAIKIDPTAKRGKPRAPDRADSDECPPTSRMPEGTQAHCCQRVEEQAAKPAFRLSGLEMSKPPLFELEQVSRTSKLAIDEDRYNWILELSSDQPGDITLKTGVGLPNDDGSFAFADGPFELGGQTWNEQGEWNAHVVDAVLGADGMLRYAKQDLSGKVDFQVPLWDTKNEFVMLVLPLTGIELKVQLDADMLCAGYLTADKTFEHIGQLTAYMPLDHLRNVHLVFEKGDHGTGLCPLTANVKPAECEKPVDEWGQ